MWLMESAQYIESLGDFFLKGGVLENMTEGKNPK